MSNRRNTQFTFNPHNKATRIDCQFTVAAAQATGFGISALNKGGRVSSVFMNTSQTPGTAANGITNPNPAAGYIYVVLQDNYNSILAVNGSFQSPLSGSAINISTGSSLTVGQVYQIVSLGTTTTAQWQAVGVPAWITPAPGVSFVASATSGSGTGTVSVTAYAGVDHIELVGGGMVGLASAGVLLPALMNNNLAGSRLGRGIGLTLLLACYKNGVLTQPTDGTNISLMFELNDSAQGV